MNGILSIGEALIDFIPVDKENMLYQKSPGGAPANVAVGVAKLGGKAAFIGKVGNDVLGQFLKKTLATYGVDVTHMNMTEQVRTGLVFVTLDQSGERSFSFYINPSADTLLDETDISPEFIKPYKILHFGSISLIHEPSRSATIKAVQVAKQLGLIVSYDPNLRLGLWEGEESARERILSMLSMADVLKISEEELEFLTGETDILNGIQIIEKQYQIPLLVITAGAKGSYVRFQAQTIFIPALVVETVDTTGAGDAYVSGLLYRLIDSNTPLTDLTHDTIVEICKFASVSGALAASSTGAMTALPSLEQVNQILLEESYGAKRSSSILKPCKL